MGSIFYIALFPSENAWSCLSSQVGGVGHIKEILYLTRCYLTAFSVGDIWYCIGPGLLSFRYLIFFYFSLGFIVFEKKCTFFNGFFLVLELIPLSLMSKPGFSGKQSQRQGLKC